MKTLSRSRWSFLNASKTYGPLGLRHAGHILERRQATAEQAIKDSTPSNVPAPGATFPWEPAGHIVASRGGTNLVRH